MTNKAGRYSEELTVEPFNTAGPPKVLATHKHADAGEKFDYMTPDLTVDVQLIDGDVSDRWLLEQIQLVLARVPDDAVRGKVYFDIQWDTAK